MKKGRDVATCRGGSRRHLRNLSALIPGYGCRRPFFFLSRRSGGIIARLLTSSTSGVDAIGICPIFPSAHGRFRPTTVANYVDTIVFGTLRRVDVLLAEAHRAALEGVALDLVPNTHSDRHRAFVESRSSRDNGQTRLVSWRDGGRSPNGRLCLTIGYQSSASAWEFRPPQRAVYYHAFLKQQPDLNGSHPQVAPAILRRAVPGGMTARRRRVPSHRRPVAPDQGRPIPTDNPPTGLLRGAPPHEEMLRTSTPQTVRR